ncbi:unnamed protein product [Oikopleura dioica]|uniref:Uncharacterized protein n=1 Tax=Oikopleura dioica TaxID=34765 RepID=E4WSY6_OIKDI|nr:unnamed protein product [Oikopleura dioica]
MDSVVALNKEICELVTSFGGTPYEIVFDNDGQVIVPDELKAKEEEKPAEEESKKDKMEENGATEESTTETAHQEE